MSDYEKDLADAKKRVLFSILLMGLFEAAVAVILVIQFPKLDVPAMFVLIAMLGIGAYVLSKRLKQLALITEGQMPDFSGEAAGRSRIAKRRAEEKQRERDGES